MVVARALLEKSVEIAREHGDQWGLTFALGQLGVAAYHDADFTAARRGFDHGVGHSLLLLYDAKAPHYQKSKEFKGLNHYPSNTALGSF
jgi:hypothetical protein